MTPMHMIEWFQALLKDADSQFIFGIGVYSLLTLFDFILGTTIALINKTFKSKTLELGIVKKVSLILFQVLCIPVSAILGQAGITGLWVAIVGMIIAQLYSTIENLSKIDSEDSKQTDVLKQWLDKFVNK